MRRLPILIAAAATLVHPLSQPAHARDRSESLLDLDTAMDSWHYRTYDENGDADLRKVQLKPSRGDGTRRGIAVSPVEPARSEVFREISGLTPDASHLDLSLFVPDAAPDDSVLKVFVRDWDFLWWQVRLENLVATHGRGQVNITLPLHGEAARDAWSAVGHARAWNTLTPLHLIEVGLAAERAKAARRAAASDVLLLDMKVRHAPRPGGSTPPAIGRIQWSPRKPRVLAPLEIRLHVDAPFTNPFDAGDIRVEAAIRRPDGQTDHIDGFYYADFSFRDPRAVAVRDLLHPQGLPEFRVRYTPLVPGLHTLTLTAASGTGTPAKKTASITVADATADATGFVRVDPDDTRFLAYDSGDHFWGIGMNVRSPYDKRYLRNVPFSQWQDEGLHLYRRLFPKYQRNGINVVEIWMSSWWLALEWIPDDVGNHGLGWMNQYRAWMLDQIFQWAAENDIYIVLVFNNHGKFGEFLDTEWDRNPYNSKNGGFLDSATEFFHDERAFDAFERSTRYTVARWGHHPNLLMWKLFTEIDLTGDKHEFYKKPVMAQWHRRACRLVKDLDPYDHIVTTHWMLSYKQINPPVATIDDLDVLTTDAYYMDRRHGVARCLALIREGTQFGRRFNKPLVVTEFGGSPHADSLQNLIKEAHTGVWTGFFCNAAIAPFFWWFGLTEEADLYGGTKALGAFAASEDRRTFEQPERHHVGPFLVRTLRNERRFLAWVADLEYYFSDQENRQPEARSDASVRYTGLQPGAYQLQIWDTRSGNILSERALTVSSSGNGTISLPEFTRDIALKIIPRK